MRKATPAPETGAGTDSIHSVETGVDDCQVVLRRVDGPFARELFISCSPPQELTEAVQQAEAIYRATQSVLRSEGGGFGTVVCETLFHRDLDANLKSVRKVRQRVVGAVSEM